MTDTQDNKNDLGAEEFYTDAQVDFNASFDDALLLEKFDVAFRQLSEFKGHYGETASYCIKLGRLKEKQNQLKEAYEVYKKLYYENPVFMSDKHEFERFRSDHIEQKLNKTKAMWNQVVAGASRFLEENPEDHDVKSTKPYVESFWKKHFDQIGRVAQNFISILEIESYEQTALLGLIQCYTELEEKEKQAYFKAQLVDSRKYWNEQKLKRTSAVLVSAEKREKSSNLESVIKIVNIGLETDPSSSELLLLKAGALQKLLCYQEALACVLAVLRVDNNNSTAIRLKKSIEGQQYQKNLKEGLDYLFSAEQENPRGAQQLAKIDSALELFRNALSYNSTNLSALAGVYRCYIRSGQPLKAQKTLKRIREIDSNFDVYSIFRDKESNQEKSEACFVATRVYGEMHPMTIFLRKYRDEVLSKHLVGRIFIRLYYRVGSSFAELGGKSPVFYFARVAIETLAKVLRHQRC